MIGTHAPKMFNARLKQHAVRAKIIAPVPISLICSKNIHMKRELWALPYSAANMARERLEAVELEGKSFSVELPEINDPALKQILLPLENWRDNEYISVTPVSSCGLIYEMFTRISKRDIPYKKWVIQPNPVSLANHGETLMLQSGSVKMLRRGSCSAEQGVWRGDFVALTARVEGMNISSGMVALGWPALTAIGGLVHSLERKTNQDIEFAIGISDSCWHQGVPRLTVLKTSTGSTTGRAKAGKISPINGFLTEEIIATSSISLLMRGNNLESIAKAAQAITRIAGGSIFDEKITVCIDAVPPMSSYLMGAFKDTERKENIDALDAALDVYVADGKWVYPVNQRRQWQQSQNTHTLNMSGYALLEEPVLRSGVRNNVPHAWAEPVFTCVTQGGLCDLSWWSRRTQKGLIYWDNAKKNV